jgi:hypothetical protein
MGVVRRKQRAHVLGVELLGPRREADQVGEEHGHDLALLARGPADRLQRSAAGIAEPCACRALLPHFGHSITLQSVRGAAPDG